MIRPRCPDRVRQPGGPGQREVDEFDVRERYYGKFRRVITLPDGTKATQIDAEFDK